MLSRVYPVQLATVNIDLWGLATDSWDFTTHNEIGNEFFPADSADAIFG